MQYKLFEKMDMIWTPAKTMIKLRPNRGPPGVARGRQGAPGAPRQPPGAARGTRQPPGAAKGRHGAPEATPGTQAAARKLPASDPLDKNNVYWTCAPKKRTGRLPPQLCRPSGSDIVHFGHLDKLFLEKDLNFCKYYRLKLVFQTRF